MIYIGKQTEILKIERFEMTVNVTSFGHFMSWNQDLFLAATAETLERLRVNLSIVPRD